MACRITKVFLASSIALGLTQCYYDNVQDLYGNTPCETAAVTYSQDISSILDLNCVGCHNATSASGGLNLEGHANAAASALVGSMINRVSLSAGNALLMPPGQPLSSCDLAKLNQWVSEGAPNN
jgi:hypothetical protein